MSQENDNELECSFPDFPAWKEPDYEVVWLLEERTYGYLLQQGAYFSKIRYTKDGNEIEENVENDEFETWRERAIEYESE